MSKFRAVASVLLLGTALAYTGCSDDKDDPTPSTDAGTDAGTPDSGTDAGLEFTTFVRDQINTRTNDTATPEKLDDKSFVDSEPADAFAPSFFTK